MTHHPRFVRVMSAVADFSHPFYAEERQRQVWNEAQTVGLQLTLWLGLVLANVMAWTGDRQVAAYAVALVAVLLVASSAVILYARRQSVDAELEVTRRPARIAIYLVLYLGFVIGAITTLTGPSLEPSTLAGMAIGATVAILAVVLAGRRRRRRALADDDADDFDQPDDPEDRS